MEEFGARLKRAREAKGVSLQDIAVKTKISAAALEALEKNDVSKLPGGIFGRAFVRAYAIEIGVDPDKTVVDFQARLEESEREAAARAPRVNITSDDREFLERQRRAVRLLRIGVIVLAVVSLAILAWRLKPFWPWSGAAADPAPPAVQVDLPVPPPPTAPPVAETPAPVVQASPPASEQPLVVEVGVTSSCWIYASADGVKVMSKLFKPGDSERITAKREVLLDVGNAGAMRWTINGRTARPLGPSGLQTKALVTTKTIDTFLQ